MPPRTGRFLSIVLMAYFVLLGGTIYTENNPILRVAHQLLTALFLGLWLLTLWWEKRPFPRTPLDLPLLAYTGARLLASLFSLDPRVSLEALWQTFTHILGFYLLVDVMRRGRQRWIMEGLFVVGGVVVTLSLLELIAWYFGLPLLPQFVQGWPQVFGFTLPPVTHKVALALNVSTWVGNFCAVVTPLAVAWAMTARQRDLRQGLWLLSAGLSGVLLFSGSRGAWLGIAAGAGTWALVILLQDDVRMRLPLPLQRLLNRRVLLLSATMGAIVALVAIAWLTLRAPRSGDVNRLDLWSSAVEMARDHPLVGVGPRQYAAALREYGAPELSQSQDHLLTAHNLPLHTLAETGLVGLLALLWLGAALLRAWWRAWQGAYPGRRRRLEGGLAAIFAFGVHNLVDTFPLTPQLMPVLVIAAYVIAGGTTRLEAQRRPAPRRQRAPILILAAILLVAQALFVPVHTAEVAHARALRALGSNDLRTALEHTRAARAADPWLDFYPIEEAYILGWLADEDPQAFLQEAIAAHEHALSLNPTWDLGWGNLAALYAQRGQLDAAIAAQEAAIRWNPVPARYPFNLGRYHEMAGQRESAFLAYLEALQRSPDLAASDFWTDPAYPERMDLLFDAIAQLSEAEPKIALRLSLAISDWDTATAIFQALDPSLRSRGLLLDMALYAARLGEDPAPYYGQALQIGGGYSWEDYLRLAEITLWSDGALHLPGFTAEQAARAALFLSEGRASRAWYILARLAEQAGAADDEIDAMLARAVPPVAVPLSFGISVYRRVVSFDELPQARTPYLTYYQYEPWLYLAERYAAAGDQEGLRRVYEALLRVDPFLREVRERLAKLSG